MNLKETFKKQGGMKLLKQYWKSGALFTAVAELFLLGKSRTALEILRLSTTLKTRQKLEKQYKNTLEKFDTNYVEKEHKASDKIWICWFQGIEEAPEIVKKCYYSVIEKNPDKDVILITSDNYSDYVHFPNFVIEKWNQGIITHTHMTDLLRLELLINHGGLWLDATVLCTEKAPSYFFDSDLFFFQNLKPGRDGNCQYISSWLMEAKTNNKILMATRDLCYEYWKKNNSMFEYFLLHDFMSIVLDRYEEEWKNVPPRDNAAPHILLLRLFEKYDENMWHMIKEQTPFHKLTYKMDSKDLERKGTFYDVLLR